MRTVREWKTKKVVHSTPLHATPLGVLKAKSQFSLGSSAATRRCESLCAVSQSRTPRGRGSAGGCAGGAVGDALFCFVFAECAWRAGRKAGRKAGRIDNGGGGAPDGGKVCGVVLA